MRSALVALLLSTSLFACGQTAPAAESAPAQEAVASAEEASPAADPAAGACDPADDCEHAAPAPTETADGARSFGAPLALEDETPLAEISADPARFAGQVVRTSGEIAAVCQRAGCWMEVRAEGVAPVRVPMAGHSFFLPRDVSGRMATLEGTVSVRELPADEAAHLASEGALATAQPLQIAATGVVIR